MTDSENQAGINKAYEKEVPAPVIVFTPIFVLFHLKT
jgi:hypothetical protein